MATYLLYERMKPTHKVLRISHRCESIFIPSLLNIAYTHGSEGPTFQRIKELWQQAGKSVSSRSARTFNTIWNKANFLFFHRPVPVAPIVGFAFVTLNTKKHDCVISHVTIAQDHKPGGIVRSLIQTIMNFSIHQELIIRLTLIASPFYRDIVEEICGFTFVKEVKR